MQDVDVITLEEADTLPGMFRQRVNRSPENPAYRFFDALNGVWADISWRTLAREVARFQTALLKENYQPGDRVSIMAHNSRYWVIFDQAALSLGLIVVPIYTDDRPDNVVYILEHAGVKLLMIGGQNQWEHLYSKLNKLPALKRIVSIAECDDHKEKRLASLGQWLPIEPVNVRLPEITADDAATIVYTSGTTGRPKGVMLSHKNILSNVHNALQVFEVTTRDVYLSFLPLSHALERTVGYYLPMMAGATVTHARSIPDLAKDLLVIKPTGLISVPRIFERVYARIKENLSKMPAYRKKLFFLAVETGWQRFQYLQGRRGRPLSIIIWPVLKRLVADRIIHRLGGRLRIAISGGAALSPEISKVLVSLGVPILQGYGLTEASPIISVNRLDDNIPDSIGLPLPGIEVKISAEGELLAKGDNIMLGYWKDPAASKAAIDAQGWLHTGDKARIEDGHIYITGRIKDIIVMANGEKVSPVDMEHVIISDPLFDQVMVIGESLPFLTLLAVLNNHEWKLFAEENGFSDKEVNDRAVERTLLLRVGKCLHDFPGFAQIYHISCTEEPWSVENGLLTPTMKMKRNEILQRYSDHIDRMYAGHVV